MKVGLFETGFFESGVGYFGITEIGVFYYGVFKFAVGYLGFVKTDVGEGVVAGEIYVYERFAGKIRLMFPEINGGQIEVRDCRGG